MIVTRIKVNGKKVRLGGYGFQKYQMLSLGLVGLQSIKTRVSRGIGSEDTAMPELSKKQHPIFIKNAQTGERRFVRLSADRGYGALKLRKTGRGIRDLNFTGKMLNAFSVRYADERKVRMDITTRDGRIKALANEKLSPWYGFSRGDERKIIARARTMFKSNIVNIGATLRGTGFARRPLWADPMGWQAGAAARLAA